MTALPGLEDAGRRAWTEAELLGLLRRRYAQMNGNGPRWALIPHVRNGAGWGGETGLGGLRTCDALAVALWTSDGLGLHGHEVKCSRADWLRELKDPTKADAWLRYCDRWWLVAAPGVVRDGELPEGWGLIEPTANGRTLRRRVPASPLIAEPWPRGLVVTLLRQAIRAGSLG